jgi:hypothetical protein
MPLYNPPLPPYFIAVSDERFLNQYGPGMFMLSLNFRALQNMLSYLPSAKEAKLGSSIPLEFLSVKGGMLELLYVAKPVSNTMWSVLDEAFERVAAADDWTILEPEVVAQLQRWVRAYNSHSMLTEGSFLRVSHDDAAELTVFTPLGFVRTDGELTGGIKAAVQAYHFGSSWHEAQRDLDDPTTFGFEVPPVEAMSDFEQDAVLNSMAKDDGPSYEVQETGDYTPAGTWTLRFFFGTFSEDIVVPYPSNWEEGDDDTDHTDYVQDYYDTWCEGKNRHGWEVVSRTTSVAA